LNADRNKTPWNIRRRAHVRRDAEDADAYSVDDGMTTITTEVTHMRLTAFAVLLLVASSFGLARAAEPAFGDVFHVRAGKSVELPDGVAFSFLNVTRDERCPISENISCVWQGEAFIDIELLVSGRKVRESMSTEKRDRTLLGHRVLLVSLYPGLVDPPPAASEYVALFRMAPVAAEGAEPFSSFASPAQARRAAERHVGAYAEAAKEICGDWESRGRLLYLQSSGGLCEMAARITPSAHAYSGYGDIRRIYFPIDNPELMEQVGERLFWFVEMPGTARDTLDQFGIQDASPLDCNTRVFHAADPAPCGPAGQTHR
jgi:hypothetical protein